MQAILEILPFLVRDDRHGLKRWLRSDQKKPGFWQERWPALCLAVLDKPVAAKCAHTVWTWAPVRGVPPPLPPNLLGVLQTRLEEAHNGWAVPWCSVEEAAIAERLAQSPQRIPASTWEALEGNGGWHWRYRLASVEEALEHAPWYAQERTRWLSTAAGRAGWLRAMGRPTRPVMWDDPLARCWAALPPRHRGPTMTAWSQHECARARPDVDMVKSYVELIEVGAALEHTAWRAWWPDRMAAECVPAHRSMEWLDLLAQVAGHPRPPPGLTWTPQQATAWGRVLAGFLLPAPENLAVGLHIDHDRACRFVLALDEWVTTWGLSTASTAHAFVAGLAQGHPRWEEMIAATARAPRNPHLSADWSRWKSRRMQEACTPPSPRAARARL